MTEELNRHLHRYLDGIPPIPPNILTQQPRGWVPGGAVAGDAPGPMRRERDEQPERVAEGAGAVRGHRADGDDEVGRGDGGGEVVERDFLPRRVDDFGVGGGQFPAGGAGLEIDPIDLGTDLGVGRGQRARSSARARGAGQLAWKTRPILGRLIVRRWRSARARR